MKKMSEEEIINQINILKQKPQLRRQEKRYLEKLEDRLHPIPSSTVNVKNILTKAALILGVLVLVGGLVWYLVTRPKLPPIDMSGHIEQNPPSHIMDTGMDESIQKHMLEHADGKGKPGILIQYNCKKYSCEKDFIDKLKTLVKKFPENVYLVPNNYDGKIILTKLGQRQILSSFDKQQIIDFIGNK